MKKKKLNLIKLTLSNISSIQKIWAESLPFNLKSIIGKKIINIYLKKYFLETNKLALGVINSKKLIGFVLFGNDQKIIKDIIFNHFNQIILAFFKSVITLKLYSIYWYINVFIFTLLEKKIKLKKKKIELLIICIKKKYQNNNIGTFLIKNSIKKNKKFFSKFDVLLVKTLKKEKKNIKFYIKNNFNVKFTIFGRVFLFLKSN